MESPDPVTIGEDCLVNVSQAMFGGHTFGQQSPVAFLFHHKTKFLNTDEDSVLTIGLKRQLLCRTKHILGSSHDLSSKAKALSIILSTPFCRPFGRPHRSYELGGFTMESLYYTEEEDLGVVLDSLSDLVNQKRRNKSVAVCLVTHGIVDVLCLRLASISSTDVGIKIIKFLLPFIKRFSEIQFTEAAKVCTILDIILKEQEGLLASEEIHLCCLKQLKLFVIEEDCVERFMTTELLTTLLNRLRSDKRHSILTTVCDVLINVTSWNKGECQKLIEAGLLDIVVMFLQENKYEGEMLESLIWLAGNITGDGVESRNKAIQAGLAPLIVDAASKDSLELKDKRNFAWVLGNFFRPNAKGVPMEVARTVLPCFRNYLNENNDNDINRDAMYGINFLITPYEGSLHETVDLLLELDIIPCIINALKKTIACYSKPAVQVAFHIVKSGKEVVTKELLEQGLCQELIGNLLLNKVKGCVVNLLHALAQAGHSQDIFKAIPFPTIVNLVRDESAEKVLDILLILAKEANSSLINGLDLEVLNYHVEYLRANDVNGLSLRLEEAIGLFDNVMERSGENMDIDGDEI